MFTETKKNPVTKLPHPNPKVARFFTKLEEGENKFTDLDLRSLDLSGLNLAGVDFSNCNFQGTNLKSANLRDANFAHSNFRGAILRNANLTRAILTDADLTDADLSRVKLNHADLNRATFKRVKCYQTVFKQAILPDGSIWNGPYYIGGTFATEAEIKVMETEYRQTLTRTVNFIFLIAILATIHFLAIFLL